MRFNRYLQEDYLMHIQGNWGGNYNGISDVFENPTAKELKSLTSTVRFIVNFASKKLYVWNWNITHTDVAGYLIKDKLIPSNVIESSIFLKTCFAGVGEVKSGKIKYTEESDCIGGPKSCKFLTGKYDDDWTKLYFGDSLISILKQSWGLKEEYVTLANSRYPLMGSGEVVYSSGSKRPKEYPFEIFVNPTVKELKSTIKDEDTPYVRYIIDFDNQKLYVWTVFVMHSEAANSLQKMGLIKYDEHQLFRKGIDEYSMGIAKINGSKLEISTNDTGLPPTGEQWNWMSEDDKWLNKWFGPDYTKNYVKKMR